VLKAMFVNKLTTVLAGLLLMAMTGCQKDTAQADREQKALKALQIYHPKTELDGEDRVSLLHLSGASVGDKVMEHVVQFAGLKSLSLWHTSVTDAGIARLVELKEVEDLNISGTQVSDQGLAILQKVTSLRRVWLRTNDRLTKAGIDSFEKALPWIFVDDEALRKPEPARSR